MTNITVRDATPADIPTILRFVRELAAFEQAADAVHVSEEDLLRDGFGPSPRFGCRIAEIGGVPSGFTLWYFNYSTWEGRVGIHLEDLYVTETARGRGLGRILLRDIAALALNQGSRRLDLSVLDWNPARLVYEKLGIAHKSDWLPYRIEGEALKKLAAG